MFISVKKPYCSTYILIYKYKYYDKVSIIAAYLPAYLYKNYRDKILHIFELFHQEKVINYRWVKDKYIDPVNKDFVDDLQ